MPCSTLQQQQQLHNRPCSQPSRLGIPELLATLCELLCCARRLLLQISDALSAAGLQAGAVCIRFPDEFRLGAFSNPDAVLRQRAVHLAAEGCAWAARLRATELIVWSPYDGYDYSFQVCLCCRSAVSRAALQ
jgi:hypothetical protein